MLFSDITGHRKIKDILLNLVNSNRVGHAYIFEGPAGVGRLSVAKAFANMMICEHPQSVDSCGKCKSCSQCLSGNHPDIKIVTNQLYDGNKKSADILVDTIRNMKQEVYIKPYEAARKIYIIPKADTMNVYAQNSLLKILEEPPEYCTIILIAENSNSFLPTILSRAPILKFFPLSQPEIIEYLVKNCEGESPDSFEMVAEMCQGSIGKAKNLLEDDEAFKLREELLKHVFALCGDSRKSIHDLALFMKQNKDDGELILNILSSIIHDLFLIKKVGVDAGITNKDKRTKLEVVSRSLTQKSSILLMELILKYNDYISKNIGFGQTAQCLAMELWEVINDRDYRS